jgi:hypothetical protein
VGGGGEIFGSTNYPFIECQHVEIQMHTSLIDLL